MDVCVYHECRGIQQTDLSTFNDISGFTYPNKIRFFDKRESHAKRIDPETVWLNWVLTTASVYACIQVQKSTYSNCDMTSNALIESVFSVLVRPGKIELVNSCVLPKNSERSGKSPLKILSLLVLVLKFWWSRELWHLHFCFRNRNTWLMSCPDCGSDVFLVWCHDWKYDLGWDEKERSLARMNLYI